MNQRGMSTLEWTMVVAVAAAALAAMGVYVSRGYQGGLRRAADAISSTPYLPGHTSGTTTITMTRDIPEEQTLPDAQPNQQGVVFQHDNKLSVTEAKTDETMTTERKETVHY